MEKNLGHATAYGYAKSKGYSGTEEEFAELMADYASVGQSAAQSAEQAAASATSASGSAATASQAASTATTKASEASQSASTATTKASEASQSATSASQSAESAGTSAQTATTAATTATTKASEAAASATTATAAKTDAETARDAAAQSASEAAASAESIDSDEFNRKIYAAFATDTATGVIASFPDGADSIPMKDVLVHIEPVQDLHGYDSPWPAGGRKNKLPNNAVTSTIQGVTYTVNNDGTIKANGTSTGWTGLEIGTVTLPAGNYVISSGVTSGYANVYLELYGVVNVNTNNEGGQRNFTLSESWEVTCKLFVRPGNAISDVVISPMIRLASVTDSSYTPYSNICPITGWTGAKVTRTGKNMLPNTAVTSTIQGVTYTVNADGSISANGTSTGWTGLTVSTFSLSAGMYTISTGIATGYYNCYIFLSKNGSEITTTANGSTDFTVSEDTELTCKMFVRPNAAVNNVVCYPMIRLASDVDTTYQPYTGYDTYDITFPSEAGTVYGGMLDVTKGELVVDRAIIASYAGEILPSTWISDRDVYSEGATPTTGAQVCYELATPITYQLTQQEITSLLGANNLWADTGNTEVEYRASTKMYIDKKITEAVSALS